MFKVTYKTLIPFSLLLLVAGCSSKPTLGDTMAKHGQGFQSVGKQWNKGNDMVREGESRLERGREQISDGQKNVTSGQDMIDKGRDLMKESELEFATRGKS